MEAIFYELERKLARANPEYRPCRDYYLGICEVCEEIMNDGEWYDKPTGFFRKTIIPGSRTWKFPTKTGYVEYILNRVEKDGTPLYIKSKIT